MILAEFEAEIYAVALGSTRWHVHPFSDPTQHQPLADAMTFAEEGQR